LPTQSGGAGGRGGAQNYHGDDKPYCDDNAQNDGQYCEGSSAGYSSCCNTGGSPGDAYDNDDDVSSLMYLPGSGGGAGAGAPGRAGGNGGASIVLYSNEMTLNGVIKANGGNGGNGQNSGGGGGGSGGTVRITACTVTTGYGLSAIIQAKGGNGGTSAGRKMIFSNIYSLFHPPFHFLCFGNSLFVFLMCIYYLQLLMVVEVEVEALFSSKPRHLTRLIIMKSLLKLMQGIGLRDHVRDKKEVSGRCFYSFQINQVLIYHLQVHP
jgi:hypothetical protein